jgi:hypothetical protein
MRPLRFQIGLSINELLSLANLSIFIAIGCVLLFGKNLKDNIYIDSISLVLGLLLCVQTHVILLYERRWNDPFILVLAYITTIYYALRLVTLYLYPFSYVFDRFQYDPSDSNFSLIVILLSNLATALGFFSINRTKPTANNKVILRSKNQIRVPVIFLFLLILNMYIIPQAPEMFRRYLMLICIFLAPYLMFMVYAVYSICTWNISDFIQRIALICAGTLLCVIQTLSGSRSALITYGQIIIFAIIVILPLKRFRWGDVLKMTLLAAVFFPLIFVIYAVTTRCREMNVDIQHMLVNEQTNLVKDVALDLWTNSGLEKYISNAFARAGFFDFTSEIIAHKNQYSEVFSLKSYWKSLIDNVLSPGFDVYDFPKVGNALHQIYYDTGPIKKSNLGEIVYQSDHISLFAELYACFGFLSLIILFGMARLLKYIFIKLSRRNSFYSIVLSVALVILFYKALISFGLDWLLLDILVYIFGLLVLCRLISNIGLQDIR